MFIWWCQCADGLVSFRHKHLLRLKKRSCFRLPGYVTTNTGRKFSSSPENIQFFLHLCFPKSLFLPLPFSATSNIRKAKIHLQPKSIAYWKKKGPTSIEHNTKNFCMKMPELFWKKKKKALGFHRHSVSGNQFYIRSGGTCHPSAW